MKKVINRPEDYTEDMLRGIYKAHADKLKYVADDLHCLCTTKKVDNKVAIVTGGGTGHLPLFLGYVGEGLLDGCGVGKVFQSPTPEQIFEISKEVDAGAGVLYLFGNYTGDIMTFEMAQEFCEMEDIRTQIVIGKDDVFSGEEIDIRRGVAGIFFLYKAAGAKALEMGTLEEVARAAEKAGENTRTGGFALTPCVIPEKGKSNFELEENEMAMGMGIHGEPGIWNGSLKSSKEIATEILENLVKDLELQSGDEVAILVNGLGATSKEELYILYSDAYDYLEEKGIKVARTYVEEFATSMEMAGASISLCKLDEELKGWLDVPVHTPFVNLK